jgi:hypothetical protein
MSGMSDDKKGLDVIKIIPVDTGTVVIASDEDREIIKTMSVDVEVPLGKDSENPLLSEERGEPISVNPVNTGFEKNTESESEQNGSEIASIQPEYLEVPLGNDIVGHGKPLLGEESAKQGDPIFAIPVNVGFETLLESVSVQADSEINAKAVSYNAEAAILTNPDGISEEGMKSRFDRISNHKESIIDGNLQSDSAALDVYVQKYSHIKIVDYKESLSGVPTSLYNNASDPHSYFTPTEMDLEFEITPVSDCTIAGLETPISAGDVNLLADAVSKTAVEINIVIDNEKRIGVADRTFNVLNNPKVADKTSVSVNDSRISTWSCVCVDSVCVDN